MIRGVLGYFIQCSSFDEFKGILKYLFHLLSAPFIDKDVSECKEKLLSLVATHKLETEASSQSEDNDLAPMDENEVKTYRDSVAYKWIANMYSNRAEKNKKQKSKNLEENLYYTEKGIDFLLYTLCRFPLWSNIMNEYFKSENFVATSAQVEAHFRTDKHCLDKFSRVDKYVANRIDHLRGTFKLAIGEYMTDKRKKRSCIPKRISKRRKMLQSFLDCSNGSQIFDKSKSLSPTESFIDRDTTLSRSGSFDISLLTSPSLCTKRSDRVSFVERQAQSIDESSESEDIVEKRAPFDKRCMDESSESEDSDISSLKRAGRSFVKSKKLNWDFFESSDSEGIVKKRPPLDERCMDESSESEDNDISSLKRAVRCSGSEAGSKVIHDSSNNVDADAPMCRKRIDLSLESVETPGNYDIDFNGSDNNENPLENWRGVIKSPPRSRRMQGSILEPHNVRHIRISIPIPTNGGLSPGIQTSNTCAVDSIYAVCGCGLADGHIDFPNEASNSFLTYVQNALQCRTRNLSAKIIKERNEILKEIYTRQFYSHAVTQLSNAIYIDCETGLASLYGQIVRPHNPALASVRITKKCEGCGDVYKIDHPVIDMQQRQLNLHNIEESIQMETYLDDVDNCKKCKVGLRRISYIFNNMVAMEVERPNQRKAKKKSGDVDHGIDARHLIHIKEISEKIQIKGIKYRLFAVIEYRHPNHFVAHVNRGYQWQTFDNLNRDSRKSNGKAILPSMLFYSIENELNKL